MKNASKKQNFYIFKSSTEIFVYFAIKRLCCMCWQGCSQVTNLFDITDIQNTEVRCPEVTLFIVFELQNSVLHCLSICAFWNFMWSLSTVQVTMVFKQKHIIYITGEDFVLCPVVSVHSHLLGKFCNEEMYWKMVGWKYSTCVAIDLLSESKQLENTQLLLVSG